jgi:hypothetical protein
VAFLINMLRPRNLFAKYVLSFVGVVVFVLASSAAIETYFIYRETITSLVHTQEEKAIAAAKAINQYLPNLERSLSWATTSAWLITANCLGPLQR